MRHTREGDQRSVLAFAGASLVSSGGWYWAFYGVIIRRVDCQTRQVQRLPDESHGSGRVNRRLRWWVRFLMRPGREEANSGLIPRL
jgi:hypothetical protein